LYVSRGKGEESYRTSDFEWRRRREGRKEGGRGEEGKRQGIASEPTFEFVCITKGEERDEERGPDGERRENEVRIGTREE
jgi:hypothetical protein